MSQTKEASSNSSCEKIHDVRKVTHSTLESSNKPQQPQEQFKQEGE
ncbi:unnamed protein product, partial [Didymodactylos carnosus]